MQKRSLLIAVFVSAIVFCSCNTHKNPPEPAFVKTSPESIESSADIENARFAFDSLSNMYADFHMKHFTVSSDTISVITGEKGLRVTVDPGALETETGRAVKGNIAVSMIELADTKDFFRANAATVSDGRMLASGGSYFIGMKANGEKLRVKKGKTIGVEFPMLREQEMELFYGERDNKENMNWKKAGIALTKCKQQEGLKFEDNTNGYGGYVPGFALDKDGKPKIFKTLNEKVYLNNRYVTITELLDTVNKHKVRLLIDTVNMWAALEPLKPGQHRDTAYLIAAMGPQYQFMIKSLPDEARMAAEKRRKDSLYDIAVKKWQTNSLAGQILKYYNPAKLTNLGWINCDRFYDDKNQTETELNIPIALKESSIKYFVLFPSINSLTSGDLSADEKGKTSISALPKGLAVNFIGFVKSKGKIFQCRQSFVTGSGPVNIQFNEISVNELKQIFGANVKA